MTNNTNTQTAKEAYEQKLIDFETRLTQLGEVLKAAKETEAPNWGHVGSMSHMEELLTQALAFSRGCEPSDIR